MLIPQPLRIHVGPENELILFNNQPIGALTCFELDYAPNEIVRSKYECVGCFPYLLAEAPERSLSNRDFPLRIYVGPHSDEKFTEQALNVWFYGKPLLVQVAYLRLHSQEKRIIRLTLNSELPSEVLNALLDLGVEVTVDHAASNV